MNLNRLLASISILPFLYLPLKSNAMSGNDLMGFLKGGRSEVMIGLSYLDGMTSSNFAYESISTRDKFKPFFCMPNNATVRQASAVVMRHLEAHPEQLHEDASALVLTSLSRAWPCR